MTRRFIYFGLLGLLFGAVLIGAPYGLSLVAESQLRARLADAPVQVQWQSISWRWPTGLSLNQVEIKPLDYPPAPAQQNDADMPSTSRDRLAQPDAIDLSGTIEHLRVDISVSALFGQERRIGDILIEGGHLKWALAEQTPSRERSEAQDAQKNVNARNTRGFSEKIWSNLERFGSIEAHDITVEVLAPDEMTGILQLGEGRLEAGAAHRKINAKGSVAVSAPRLASVLGLIADNTEVDEARDTDLFDAGAPNAKISWLLEGELEPEKRLAKVVLSAEDPDESLLMSDIPQLGMLRLGRVEVEVLTSTLHVSAHDVRARLGAAQSALAELTVARAGATAAISSLTSPKQPRPSTPADKFPAIDLTEPRLLLEPTRLEKSRARLQSLKAALRLVRAPNSSNENDDPGHANAPTDEDHSTQYSTDINRIIKRWLQIGRARVERGQLAIRLVDEGERPREIVLVDDFDAQLANGRLSVRGNSTAAQGAPGTAGQRLPAGRVSLDAHFLPGQLAPEMAVLKVDNLRLQDLPGIQQGRTLPRRGVLGRVGGTLDARVNLWADPVSSGRTTAAPQLNLAGHLSWRDGEVDVAGIASQALTGIDLGVDFSARYNPSMALVALDEGHFHYGPITAHFKASLVDYRLDPVVDFHVKIDEIACQDALRALPTGLLGDYNRIEAEGEAGPSFSLHWPIARPRRLRIHLEEFSDKCRVSALKIDKEAWPSLSFARDERPEHQPDAQVAPRSQSSTRAQALWERLADGASAHISTNAPANEHSDAQNPGDARTAPARPIWPRPPVVAQETYELPEMPEEYREYRYDDVFWLNRPFIKQVTEGVSEDAEIFVGPGTESYVPLNELPPFVAGAAYLSEEMSFYTNKGIALGLIERAIRIDLERGRFVYGGSTITQQLVKNLFLTRNKLLSRKLIEALISWRIDEVVPKWRVLELYLNCIEYAPDVYGIGPAAQYYFGKDARDLTPKEAVFIAVLKPAPWYGDRFRRRGRTPVKNWWFNRMVEIMDRLVERGYLTAQQADDARPYVIHWDADGRYLPDEPVDDPTE